MDVFLRDENRIINVEVQTGHRKELPKRSRYYQSVADASTTSTGRNPMNSCKFCTGNRVNFHWKLGEFVLEIGIEFTGNLEHGLPFVKRNPRRGWCVTEAAAMAWAEVGGEG
ncbi:MAG: hypothetical protein IJW57_10615 [Spirochaetaceae bacterium]|nr:hypothetical protein [Spirochaetaceae bacterium]MBQ8560896.1 hypothetical protein [Spirochaetaceae bacterium]